MLTLCLTLLLQDAPKATLKDFEWLAGAWEGDGGFEEHWMAPAGGLMLAMGRQTKGDETLFYEFIRLEERKGVVTYNVSVMGGKEVAFTLTSLKDGEAVFENPKHDFPTTIRYRREKDGSLSARIEGTQNGKPAGEDFKMKKRK